MTSEVLEKVHFLYHRNRGMSFPASHASVLRSRKLQPALRTGALENVRTMLAVMASFIKENDVPENFTVQAAQRQLEREFDVSLEGLPLLPLPDGTVSMPFEREELELVVRTIERRTEKK